MDTQHLMAASTHGESTQAADRVSAAKRVQGFGTQVALVRSVDIIVRKPLLPWLMQRHSRMQTLCGLSTARQA